MRLHPLARGICIIILKVPIFVIPKLILHSRYNYFPSATSTYSVDHFQPSYLQYPHPQSSLQLSDESIFNLSHHTTNAAHHLHTSYAPPPPLLPPPVFIPKHRIVNALSIEDGKLFKPKTGTPGGAHKTGRCRRPGMPGTCSRPRNRGGVRQQTVHSAHH